MRGCIQKVKVERRKKCDSERPQEAFLDLLYDHCGGVLTLVARHFGVLVEQNWGQANLQVVIIMTNLFGP